MRVPMKSKPSADDVRRVALAALATALEDRKDEVKKKPGLTGMRAVATGAVIYTAGRAAFTGRRFIRDRFGSDGEPEARDDADEEMVDDEEYDDDEDYDDEPRAEDEEDFEDEDEDEPRAEDDEDVEDEDEEEDEQPARRAASSRRAPSHPKRESGDAPPVELPRRPSRSRAPIGLS